MSARSSLMQPGISPGSPVVPKAKPADMSTQDLAVFVADTFAKLKTPLPYIIELRERFAALPRGNANVMGCRTWTEFCSKVLHRTDSAVRKAIAAESDWRHAKAIERENAEIAKELESEPEPTEPEPTEEELEEFDEWLRQQAEKPREIRNKPVPELAELFGGLPHNLNPTAAEIVETGYRALAKQRHPDLGGSQEAMQALNATVACLRRIIR